MIAGIAYKDNKFDGVYLGRRGGSKLTYAGKVERGFTEAVVRRLKLRAQKLKLRTSPLSGRLSKPKATWLKPELLADVEYRALTGEGTVRHPSFKGMREDL